MGSMKVPVRGRAMRATVGAFVAMSAVIGSLVVPSVASAAEAVPAPDGRSQETAAASCWEIKKAHPDATDGVYWLVTPSLVAPEQFYCDQTTDGGGWVLIGRGREGWRQEYAGQGTAASVRDTPSGVSAFAPAELPAKTVDGLLNGGRVDALADGVRVRRAADAAGSQWQEVRFQFAHRDRWVWTFGA